MMKYRIIKKHDQWGHKNDMVTHEFFIEEYMKHSILRTILTGRRYDWYPLQDDDEYGYLEEVEFQTLEAAEDHIRKLCKPTYEPTIPKDEMMGHYICIGDGKVHKIDNTKDIYS